MRFLRGFGSFVLQVVLIVCLILLGVSFALKDTLVDLIYDEVIKEEITNNIDIEQNKELVKLFEMDESKVFIEDILSDITSTYDTGYDIEKEIVIFIRENKDEFSKLYDVEFSDEDINKLESEINKSDLNEKYSEIKNEFKSDLDKEERMIFDIYNFVVSSTFKIMLICISLINLLLIALLQKSYFKWIRALGVVSIIGGVLGFVFGIIIDYLLMEAFEMNALEIGFLSKYSIGLLVGGIIAIVIYFVIARSNKMGEV